MLQRWGVNHGLYTTAPIELRNRRGSHDDTRENLQSLSDILTTTLREQVGNSRNQNVGVDIRSRHISLLLV
jgi:hypothetical protein